MRSFTWGHVRQLDRVSGELLARAWSAGAGPDDEPVTVDVDSTICETYGLAKQGGVFGYTHVRGYHPLLATIAGTGDVVHCRLRGGNANSGRGAKSFLTETFNRIRAAGATGPMTLRADSGFYARKVVDACRDAGARFSITVRLHKALHKKIAAILDDAWTPIPYFLDGADVAETTYRPFGNDQPDLRLIVRRVRPTPGTQLALFVEFSYHAFITDRHGTTLELEADHRRHAEIENSIRDLKYGVGLNHLPSGRFGRTLRGLGSTSSPTTSHAGSAASGSVKHSSPTRPCGVVTCASRAGSLARAVAARCTSRHVGRGPTSSTPRSRTCAPSCSSPDAPPQRDYQTDRPSRITTRANTRHASPRTNAVTTSPLARRRYAHRPTRHATTHHRTINSALKRTEPRTRSVDPGLAKQVVGVRHRARPLPVDLDGPG